MNTLAIGLAGLGLAAGIGRLRGTNAQHRKALARRNARSMKLVEESFNESICAKRRRLMVKATTEFARADTNRLWIGDGEDDSQVAEAFDALSLGIREYQKDCLGG